MKTRKYRTPETYMKELYEHSHGELTFISTFNGMSKPLTYQHKTCGGTFTTKPSDLARSFSCPLCSRNRKRTPEDFVNEVESLVHSEYTVIGRYKNNRTPVAMRHELCGCVFNATPSAFLGKQQSRCPKCAKRMRLTQAEFKSRLSVALGSDYVVIGRYKNSKSKVKMLHKVCGHEFNTLAGDLLNGVGCPMCRGTKRKTNAVFQKEIDQLTGGAYKLMSNYKNNSSKVKLRHSCGHEFYVTPNLFLRRTRCPVCTGASRAELVISEWLTQHNVLFESQKLLHVPSYKNPLRFDFYLPDDKLVIEFDGEQHFFPVEPFGGINGTVATQKRDHIKNTWCRHNNIKMLRIKYNDFVNVNTILERIIRHD